LPQLAASPMHPADRGPLWPGTSTDSRGVHLRTGTTTHFALAHESNASPKPRYSNAAIGSDTWTDATGVWGATASNTWSWTLRHGDRKDTANYVWSPWTPMTTSIVSAHIRILPTLAAGFWRGSASRTPPSLGMKLSSLPPSSSCTKRKTDTESH